MSKSRAKKKQRRRARPVAKPEVVEVAASASANARRKASAKPAAKASASAKANASAKAKVKPGRTDAKPSRLDVRDGVARPQPIWAPFPLTEIGMTVGVTIFAIGFESSGQRAIWLESVAALMLVVVVGELCVREHFSGFRSHVLLLAAMPVVIVHGLVVLAITRTYAGPISLAVDLGVAGALAWVLRGRFRLAHERAREG